MNFNEYQRLAQRTANYSEVMTFADANHRSFRALEWSYVSLGLAGEAGEVANKVKKILRDDAGELTRERKVQLIDEMGDVLWYLSEMARLIGADLDTVAQQNLYKLQARVDNGTLHGEGDKR